MSSDDMLPAAHAVVVAGGGVDGGDAGTAAEASGVDGGCVDESGVPGGAEGAAAAAGAGGGAGAGAEAHVAVREQPEYIHLRRRAFSSLK